ncbi:MAG: YqeG family HAD IIIA-type phosphatase [Clostridiales bacterium]|jgi:HAD superfamily phosphatase (TIGR01668 family)|nr:YqeG family HAD IIIA-type phosphatase [Clostridiales bacterium]
MAVFRRFFPAEMAESVRHIDYGKFWERGIRGLIFDIDNTLASFDVPEPCADTMAFLRGLNDMGFAIAFLSNNSKERVENFNKNLGYPHVWKAKKPRLGGILRALDMLGLPKEQVVLIGDQIFTDCWVGQRAGIYTVLTKPIAARDEWQVKLKRYPERLVLRAFARSGDES